MHKNLQNINLKLDLLSPPLASLVPLATILQINMLSCIDCGVSLHFLQTQDQDPKKKKKKK